MIAAILSTVLGGLFLTGIIAAFRSHWLYLIVPKLHLNTPLSAGHFISLDITNAGFLAEEEIRIRLKKTCNYEFFGSSKSTVTFSEDTISVPRLSRFESVTVLLLVERKPFDPSDVESVESKTSVGKIVAKNDKAIPLWQYFVVLPLICFAMGWPFVLGTTLGADWGYSAFDYLAQKFEYFLPSKQLAGFKIEEAQPYASTGGKLTNVTLDRRVVLQVSEIVRRGDILDIGITISNNTTQTLVVEASVTSSAATPGPLDFWDMRVKDTFVAVASKQTRHVKAFLPEDSVPKIVFLNYRLKLGNDSTAIEQTITF